MQASSLLAISLLIAVHNDNQPFFSIFILITSYHVIEVQFLHGIFPNTQGNKYQTVLTVPSCECIIHDKYE